MLQCSAQKAVERPGALQLVNRRLHRWIGIPGGFWIPLAGGHERVASSVTRMTAVEHRHDVRPALDDLVEEQAQLLVGERPDELAPGFLPGVEQQQVLELARRIAEGELGRWQFLAPMAGVGEQNDVTLPGLGEVRPETRDHTLPGCLTVRQGDDAAGLAQSTAKVFLEAPHVVAAALQGNVDRRSVGIDADQKAEHPAIHRAIVAQIVTGVARGTCAWAFTQRLQSAPMGEVDYTNLRLSFKQRGDRDYEVTAAIDGGATTTSTFTIPMSDEALQEAIRDLSETRSAITEPTTRKITPVTAAQQVTAQQFGTTLADALITGDVATMFDEARCKGAVRVRLNMTTEPELLRIPWEFLRRNGKDLASQRDCTIVRELVTAEPARPYLVEGKIRMLGVIANPRRDLDVEGEKRRVTEALAKCNDQVELDWLEDCTFKSLQRKLQGTYHILHFVGHSAFTDEGESIILLSDENGMPKEQSADSIAQLIGRQNSLQLVVFNSCDGARTKLDDPFASIATMLVQQGESAVIAMQFEISDPAAKAFAEELYFCLIDRRYPIDAAVAEARIAMLDVNQIEFATPVLFLRPGFVDLFNFKESPVAAAPAVDAPPNAPVSALAAQGLPPPNPPGLAPPAVGPPARPSKSKRWMVVAGGGVAAAVAGVVAVVTLSSGGEQS